MYWAVAINLPCIIKQRELYYSMYYSRELYYSTLYKYTIMETATTTSLQSCPTLCDPTDSSPPGSPAPGILQARTLEWVDISFSNAWKWKVKVKSLSRARLLATPWTAAYQAPSSMGFSRQEYWSGAPLPSPDNGDYNQSKLIWSSLTLFNNRRQLCPIYRVYFFHSWSFKMIIWYFNCNLFKKV